MVLETAHAADDRRYRGITGDYLINELVEGELYELVRSRPGQSVEVIGYAYSEREAYEKIRKHDLA